MTKNYQNYRLMQPVVEVFTPSLLRFLLVATVAVVKTSFSSRLRVMAGSHELCTIPILVVPEVVWKRETREQYEQRRRERRAAEAKAPKRQRGELFGEDLT